MTPGDIQLADQIYTEYNERFNSSFPDRYLRECTKECLMSLGWTEEKATKASHHAQLI